MMSLAEAESLASEINALSGWCALIEENVFDGGYLVRAWDYGSNRRHGAHVFRAARHWQTYIRAHEKALAKG